MIKINKKILAYLVYLLETWLKALLINKKLIKLYKKDLIKYKKCYINYKDVII